MTTTEHRYRTEEAQDIAHRMEGVHDALRTLDNTLGHYARQVYGMRSEVIVLAEALGVMDDIRKEAGHGFAVDELVILRRCSDKVRELTGKPVLAEVRVD